MAFGITLFFMFVIGVICDLPKHFWKRNRFVTCARYYIYRAFMDMVKERKLQPYTLVMSYEQSCLVLLDCGLESSPYHALAEKYLPNGSCGVVSFGLAGGREAASTFMKELKLAAIETHVADARTCCLNPASSTHRQMNDEQLKAAGVPAELVRMSCGLESSEDLIADIAQALDKI